MFGGNKKKKTGADGAKPSNSGLFDLSQLSGLAGIPQSDMDEDDSALEAELAALIADDGSAVQSKSVPRKKVPLSQIDHLAAEAMQSMEEEELTDEDLNDPSFLAELALLSQDDADMDNLRPSPQPSPRASPKTSPAPKRKSEDDLKAVIQERIQNYEIALKNAQAANESSKVRRYGRGLKTLKDFDKKLQRGMKIDESEIPPVVATGGEKQTQPSAPEPAPPPPDNEITQAPSTSNAVPAETDHSTKGLGDSQMALLKERQHEYKMAALEAKRAGQLQIAADHLRVAKQFDSVIDAIEQGEEVDLSGMPPPPSSLQDAATLVPPAKQQMMQTPTIDVSSPAGHSEPTPPGSEAEAPMPSTPLEALQLRHDSYKTLLDKATQEGNASKCRRLGRIVKSYQDAIKKEKAGRPVDYEELPALPGFPPIPPRGGAPKSPGQQSPGQPSPGQPAPRQPSPGQPSSPGQRQGPAVSPQAAAPARPALARPPSVKEAQNLKNLRVLVQRQKEYKMMALKAKKEGDRDEAMRLLKVAKGFDSMITASENGLPVNMDSIPPSPLRSQVSVDESEIEGEGVHTSTSEEISAEILADSSQLYTRLITTLTRQVQICTSNEKQYSQLGNLSTSKRFGEMKKSCQQDLDLLVVSRSHSDPVPRFHFESRTIPSIRVCPDLTDTEVEINIVRGTHYKLPSGEKDLDTFVKFEFPYPSDEPQSGKSGWGKGFETIEYDHASKLNIQRNRTFASCVKRRSVKFEVYYGRGFLRSDKLLAQASLKLAELESKCEIHESLPLYDGRKPTGGKLEVKVRLHHPLSGVKEDQTKEKWLVIDSTNKKSKVSTAASPQKNVQSSESLEVLKWELDKLKKKTAELQAHRRTIPKELISLQKVTADRILKLHAFIKEGSKEDIQAYANRLNQSLPGLLSQAKQLQQAGNVDKARVIMTKKRLIENEISSLTGKDKR